MVPGSYRYMWAVLANHYVEWIAKFVVVNAPPFLATLFAALAPLMPEGTLDKLIVAGSQLTPYSLPGQSRLLGQIKVTHFLWLRRNRVSF